MTVKKAPIKKTPAPTLRLIGAVAGLKNNVRDSDYELIRHGAPEEEETKPVTVHGIPLPKNFEVGFFFESLLGNKTRLWRVILQMELSDRGIPKTKEILISGDIFRKTAEGIVPDPLLAERVNASNLILVGRDIRNLEVKALTLAIKMFAYMPVLPDGKAYWLLHKMAMTEKMVRRVEKDTANRIGYKKNSPEFLTQISELYNEAEIKGLPPVKYIGDVIGGIDLKEYGRRTAENWVRVARREQYLPKKANAMKVPTKTKGPLQKNSTPKKSARNAVPATKKPTTTKKGNK